MIRSEYSPLQEYQPGGFLASTSEGGVPGISLDEVYSFAKLFKRIASTLRIPAGDFLIA